MALGHSLFIGSGKKLCPDLWIFVACLPCLSSMNLEHEHILNNSRPSKASIASRPERHPRPIIFQVSFCEWSLAGLGPENDQYDNLCRLIKTYPPAKFNIAPEQLTFDWMVKFQGPCSTSREYLHQVVFTLNSRNSETQIFLNAAPMSLATCHLANCGTGGTPIVVSKLCFHEVGPQSFSMNSSPIPWQAGTWNITRLESNLLKPRNPWKKNQPHQPRVVMLQ